MAYDYEGAKRAGLTDAQIAQHLAQKTGYRYDDAKAAGLDDSTIVQHLLQKDSGPQLIATPPLGQRLVNRGMAALPDAGGFVGGLAGGALGAGAGGVGAFGGAVGGAAVGGAAGKAAQEALLGHPLDAGRIAGSGLQQGAYEAAGGAIAAGATRVARPLMRKAVSATPSLVRRFRFGTQDKLAEFLLKNELPLKEEGVAAATAKRNVILNERAAKLASVKGTVGAGKIARQVVSDAENALGRPLTRAESSQLILKVQREADDILAGRTHGVVPKANRGTPAQPPSKLLDEYGKPAIPAKPPGAPKPSRYTAREVEQIKEVAAERASPTYRAEQAAKGVSSDPKMDKQVAAGARQTLEKIKGVRGMNTELRQLKGGKLAIESALERDPGQWVPVKLGPLQIGTKLSREKMATLAIALRKPVWQKIFKQSPRLGMALLFNTENPDATDQP